MFKDNVFLLLGHKEEILSDSRMFYAPVSVNNSLAYIGANGFKNQVLGVYIEWWLTCEASVTVDSDGNKGLLYQFSGSPISGSNQCHYIFSNGRELRTRSDDFSKAWRCFRELNMKYEKFKRTADSFSLKEVVDILTAK